ncbi:MAG: YceI family protein [Cognaticolwellia sp.]
MRPTIVIIFTLLFTAISAPTFATWTLDNNASRLNFVSVKKGTVAENHQFTQLSGEINKQAQVNISVDLASVNTHIAIRDQRMKKFVFETDKFSAATFVAQLDKSLLQTLKVGEVQTLNVDGKIAFHGQQQGATVEVSVVKLAENKILVNTIKPFFINADAYGVVAGINKLKELASLPSINTVVPVNFSVTFNQ